MPDFLINAGARLEGLTTTLMDLLPLLGAAGSILVILGGILVRGSAAHDPAGIFHALHPTADELAALTLAVGVIRAHFKHATTAAALVAATSVPLPNAPPSAGPDREAAVQAAIASQAAKPSA